MIKTNLMSASMPRGRASAIRVPAFDADRYCPDGVAAVRYVFSWRGRPYNTIHLDLAIPDADGYFLATLPERCSNPPTSELTLDCFWITSLITEQHFATITIVLTDAGASSYLSSYMAHTFSTPGRAVVGQLGAPFVSPSTFTLAAAALHADTAPGANGIECRLHSTILRSARHVPARAGDTWLRRRLALAVAAGSTLYATIISPAPTPISATIFPTLYLVRHDAHISYVGDMHVPTSENPLS
jgi:hypothetical protein